MANRYQKHYTREEARALLPQVRQWLARLNELRADLERYDKRLNGMLHTGHDLGGSLVNDWIRTLAGTQVRGRIQTQFLIAERAAHSPYCRLRCCRARPPG